ncbi:sirohydrochlorin chelatase [Cohnella terricola]|uniref:Cobalamin biosynthesis protein CbiX n=1 Tax=Cohnella terricola TaxID=1289167 RepID=A0A559JTE8_9BACL|nr:CbiX/SirB N-terminal domain-containing protein [Cohnella terricola]TVY03156.1 cobalamin biosynthesis protein CbiX [Cohnella terricola]
MKPGLLVISHGSSDRGWVSLVDRTIETVRERMGDALRIEAGFLELVDGRLIQDGIDRLIAEGVTDVLALPLFVSSGSTHVDEIGWALGAFQEPGTETDLERFRTSPMRVTYEKPMGTDPEIIGIVAERLSEMSVDPSEEIVLLVGHGSSVDDFREKCEQELPIIAKKVAEKGKYAEGTTALLLPSQVGTRLAELADKRPGNRVLVCALFLGEGYFTKTVVPRRLEESGLMELCRYNGRALMPHPNVAEWIGRKASEWLKNVHAHT